MKLLNFLKHFGIVILGVVLIIGVPLWCTGYIQLLLSGADVDAVSSASVVLDQPSGDFIILINKDYHKDQDTLNDWIRFFGGEVEDDEVLVIFDDISCSVAAGDTLGADMADSLRSMLPENQMQVKRDDATLILSRADRGLFDIIIMSREFGEMYHIETAYKDNVEVVSFKNSEA